MMEMTAMSRRRRHMQRQKVAAPTPPHHGVFFLLILVCMTVRSSGFQSIRQVQVPPSVRHDLHTTGRISPIQQPQQYPSRTFLRASKQTRKPNRTDRKKRSPYSLSGFGGVHRKAGMIAQLNQTKVSPYLQDDKNATTVESISNVNGSDAASIIANNVSSIAAPNVSLAAAEVVHNATTSKLFTNATAAINATTTPVKRIPYSPGQPYMPHNIFFTPWMNQLQGATAAALTGEVPTAVPPLAYAANPAALLPAASIPVQTDILAGRKPTDALTVGDLEQILRDIGYNAGASTNPSIRSSSSSSLTSSQQQTQRQSSSTRSSKSGVAFPQMSVLSYRDLMIGSTVSATILGMLLSMTIFPSLWFVGGLSVGAWGYQVSRSYPQQPPTNVMGEFIISLGRRVAKFYLNVYDGVNGVWFMYKTGQLSYAYYKKYAQLDDRFALTTKIDAWNARFQEGKRTFDKWEQENEVGRKLLAGLRTAWLVEEKTFKQSRKKWMKMGEQQRSKYRIVQYMYDVLGWFQRLWMAVWRTATGGGSSELRDVLKGIRISISQQRLDELVPRIGAAVGAFFVLNIVGALFALSPNFLGILAITTGLVWPSWVPELGDRLSLLLSDLRAQGQGGGSNTIGVSGEMALGKQQFYDKSRYSFFTRQDGTKQWYRSGQSAYRWSGKKKKGSKKKKTPNDSLLTSWMPWRSQGRTPGKEQWGIFG